MLSLDNIGTVMLPFGLLSPVLKRKVSVVTVLVSENLM